MRTEVITQFVLFFCELLSSICASPTAPHYLIIVIIILMMMMMMMMMMMIEGIVQFRLQFGIDLHA